MKHAARPGAVPRPATVSDVARLAGVSTMTVSRVVNGEPTVRPDSRAKVQAAVAALNYMPNPSARKLAGSRPILLGLLYSDARAGYLNGFMLGLLGKISLRHVQLNAEYCDASSDGVEAVTALLASGVDGLILPPPFCDSRPLLDLIARSNTPAVTVSAGRPATDCYGVGIDDYKAAHEMTRHLLALGHQRLGLYVPSDLTVVGFDDAPLATTIWPELTTVRQPIGEMAGAAVDMLVRHIRAWRNGVKLPFSQQTMEHQLIRRQSDAAPKRRPIQRLGIVA